MLMDSQKDPQPFVETSENVLAALEDLRAVAHFFFEMGMLKRTARSGFQFLGSGKESVADHSFR
ncbi:MAG: hypothetical protein ACUVR9_08850, partial [Desulfosoma sp.]